MIRDPRWTDETEALVRRHISSAVTAVNRADPGAKWDLTVDRARGLLVALTKLGLLLPPGGQTRTEELRKAVRRLGHGLIAVSPLLDKPYSDAPHLAPWSRFVHPRLLEVRRLVGIDPPATTTGEPHHD